MNFEYERYKTGNFDVLYGDTDETIDEVFLASNGRLICRQGGKIYFALMGELSLKEKQPTTYVCLDFGNQIGRCYNAKQTDNRNLNLHNQIEITWNCHGSQIVSVSVVAP